MNPLYRETTQDPETLLALKRDILASLHCALPGVVESFDPDTQTADIRPAVSAVLSRAAAVPSRPSAASGGISSGGDSSTPLRSGRNDMQEMAFPLLRDVPVCMPVHFEVSPGDKCLVVFADRDADAFLAPEGDFVPSSGRLHSLSDGFAFIGFDSGGGQGGGGPDPRNYYSKTETDALLAGKADTSHDHDSRYYTEPETDGFLAGKAESVHEHDAGDITSGLLPLDRGGTGQEATGVTTTVSEIAIAEAGCTISTAQFAYWGKMAMLRLVVKKSAAVSSGTTTLCTLLSGKRPRYNAGGVWAWNNGAQVNTAGKVQVNGAISANTNLTILATYILA